MSHTPGPWTWNPDFREIQGDGGDYAVAIVIAKYARYDGSLLTPDAGEADANARLIAAAPDLLRIAQEIYAPLLSGTFYDDHDDASRMVGALWAAIVKALHA